MNSSLIADLVTCVGEDWVLTNPADLYLYSYDSGLDRALPSAVVLPGNTDQVAKVVAVLAMYKQPFVARGAATSLCGGPIPLQNAVVIALARLTKIKKLNKEGMEIHVEPGVVNLRLQQAVEAEHLFYPPDPGSQKACTLGGNVGANAGGPHCLKYGVTSQYVMGLDWVMPDGRVTRLNVEDPGFDIVGLLVGSEGTLGIATGMRLKLLPLPAYVRTMLVSFSSIEAAIQTVTDIIAAGILPATLEAMDSLVVKAIEAFVHAGYPLDAAAVLLIEVDGDKPAELNFQAVRIKELCDKNDCREFRFAKDEAERAKLWEGRRGAYAAMARLAPNVLVEDGAVPRTKLPEALKKIQEIASAAGLKVALLFHAGDGNLHPQILFDERNAAQTKIVKEAGHKMLKACVDLGGTISGEHGIGSDKREAMRWLFTRETLSLFRRLKNVFDPENLSNPDKLIPLVSKAVLPPDPVVRIGKESEDGFGPLVPQNEQEMIVSVKMLSSQTKPFGVQGARTKHGVHEHAVISTAKLNKILDFDKGNLTLTVQAGALVQDLRTHVEKAKQFLWVAGEGTVGGVIATKSSVTPPLRDLILGMRVLLPTGEVVQFGAKTMKNVAGYDVPKLFIGSWGTLGIILDVTFRLFPTPPKSTQAQTPVPFVFKDIHRRIKTAFDPQGILSTRTSALTAEEIAAPPPAPAGPNAPEPSEVDEAMRKIKDKFWM